MRKEKLSSLCKITNGFAFKSDDYVNHGYRVMRITNVQKGFVVDNDPKFIPHEIADKATGFKLCAGDILVSLTGNVGRVGVIQPQHLPAVLNQRVGLIRPSSAEINEKYLFLYLNSDNFEREAIRNSNGVAQLNLSSKWIESHEIPLPTLDDQKRIAHLLGKVEGLIARRKHHLQQLDDLLKSVFLEMFGDPVRNEKGWDESDFATIISGMRNGLSPSKAGAYKGRVYTLSAITGDFFREIFKEDSFSQIHDKYFPADDDFLVCRGNGNINLVGKGYFTTGISKDVIFPDTIIAVSIQPNTVNKHFLEALWKTKFIRQQIENNARTTNGAHKINQGVIEKIKIVQPPADLQNRFAAIVEKVESLKSRYQHSLTDLETLYGALTQKAFKGELDLSRVVLPVASAKEVFNRETREKRKRNSEVVA